MFILKGKNLCFWTKIILNSKLLKNDDCPLDKASYDDLWVYDGQCYDFTPYVNAHPGGIAILMAKGTDCTELVEQIHPFKRDKIKDIIKRFKVDGITIQNANKSIVNGAYLDFLINAEKVLKDNNLTYADVTKSSTAGWTYVIFGFVSFYGLLSLLLMGINPWLIAPLLGIAMGYHCQYLVHDGSHSSITNNRKLNYFMALYASAVMQYGGFTKDHWSHHLNTNDIDKDTDVGHLANFFRVLPQQDIKPWHKFQHILFYLLGPLLGVLVSLNWFRLSLFERFDIPWLPSFFGIWHKILYFLFVFLLNIAPFIVFGFTAEGVWVAIIPRAVQWYLFLNVVQWSHFHDINSDSLQFYKGDRAVNFFQHVLSTTQNVSERNPIMKYLLVGNQIQHHLLPLISTSRTHLFIDVTRQTADKFSIEYLETPSVVKQIVRNYCYFKEMGKKSI